MEVSGKRAEEQSLAASVTKASAEDFEFYCEPCDSEGNHVEANGYCKNCEEFLCATCYSSHRRVRLTRNHILLDSKKMPNIQKPRKWDTECTEKCPQHPTEIIFYYCKTHDVVGCHVCMSSNHSDCCNDYIPDISSGTTDSLEYKAMLQELDDVENEALRKEKKANEDIVLVGSCYTKAIEDMQKFKQDVNDELDKMEQLILKDVRKAKENTVTTFTDELNDCNYVKNCVEGIKKNMKQRDVSVSQIFVQMKLNKTRLDGCRKMLHNWKADQCTKTCKFETDEVIKNKLESKEGFGRLVFAEQTKDMTRGTLRPQVITNLTGKLNVKSSANKWNCAIVSIDMLSSHELVLADFENMTIKIFGMQECKITNEMKLSARPFDIAVLNKNTILVLLIYDLVFVRKSVNLLIEKKIMLSSQSCGLRCINGNLFILSSYPFPKIEILNQEGEALHTILSDSKKSILQSPQHIAVSSDEMSIYVSDYSSNNKITRLSNAGAVIDVYKNQKDFVGIEQPRGIAVADDGSLFICHFFGDTICMCSADFSDMKVILTEADGIKGPETLYFCNKERKLYVAINDCNEVLIYSLKW